jgi:hypothetical protein
MWFEFNTFNLVTLGLMVATVLLAILRFRLPLDSNLPLTYYLFLLGYWHGSSYDLDGYWVLTGFLCGMLLRFEFLGGAFARLVRTMELAVFVYVLSRGTLLLFRW